MKDTRPAVLIVDDSAVVRETLSQLVQSDSQLRLLGVAADPIIALEKMRAEWPDVIVLDIEMPRMDGITFLRQLSKERPTAVVICSSHAEKDARVTMQALALGAAEVITKPKMGLRDFLKESADEILNAIKAAARADARKLAGAAAALDRSLPLAGQTRPAAVLAAADSAKPGGAGLILIGASTGGTTALEMILSALPATLPPILVVQHMPEAFTAAFARRLDEHSAIAVREGSDGEALQPGHCLLAPGGRHMRLMPSGRNIQIFSGAPVNRHRPSVDVLFESVAARPQADSVLALLLTGMGDDGARGLLQLRQAGAATIGQDRESSVVYGMAAEARKLGAVERELPLEKMAAAIVEFAAGRARRAR